VLHPRPDAVRRVPLFAWRFPVGFQDRIDELDLPPSTSIDESIFSTHESQHRDRKELRLRNHARKLGFEIIPAAAAG
jgi:hypothetical protein